MKWVPAYNAPVVLTFALLAFLVHLVDARLGGRIAPYYFAAWPHFDYRSGLSWFRLVSHVFGHKDMAHFVSNFSMILIVGPFLEEKYGSRSLLLMMFITALATGVFNTIFFSTGLMGASGIVFMMILLGSFVNHAPGRIPLTFILVVALYLAGEVTAAFHHDDISHFAHILGGGCGTLFGFWKGGGTAKASKGRAKKSE